MYITTVAPHAPVVLRWLLLCFTLITAGCATRGAERQVATPPLLPERDSVRVLAVGNSFSDNATSYLRQLAEAAGNQIVIGRASIGGGRLQQHWAKVDAFQKDPQRPEAKYSSGDTLHDLLSREPWDYVTIQQFSWLSHDTSTHEPWASNLVGYIREHAPDARLLVHQTWAYRVDDRRFDPDHADYGKPPGGPTTQREMYERLTAAYDELAAKFNAVVIPVGDAFYLADTDDRRGFKPDDIDLSTLEPPTLPDATHSLHVGHMWRKQEDGSMKLGYDGHHASVAGRYLGSCVWFEVLFGESVVGNTFVPEGLDADYAAFLQKVAHKAVVARAKERPAAHR